MKTIVSLSSIALIVVFSCSDDRKTLYPEIETITESIYASGTIKSNNQYNAYTTVSGVVAQVFVKDGDTVRKGDPLLKIANMPQQLNRENARLAASFYDYGANREKLADAQNAIALSRDKMRNDSSLYFRQAALWKQNVGTRVELEQRELNYEHSKNAYRSAIVRYNDLKRQLDFQAKQSQTNLRLTQELEEEFTLRSDIDGIVYSVGKEKGEMVSPQLPVAVIGEAGHFVLEMEVDEYDIVRIRKGQEVIISMDSYKNSAFRARVTRIRPLMNERTKTFTVEAEFTDRPPVLYPNISFEANIILRKKEKALLIPLSCLGPDDTVTLASGEKRKVKTGLRDFRKVEIVSGLKREDEIVTPEQ